MCQLLYATSMKGLAAGPRVISLRASNLDNGCRRCQLALSHPILARLKVHLQYLAVPHWRPVHLA